MMFFYRVSFCNYSLPPAVPVETYFVGNGTLFSSCSWIQQFAGTDILVAICTDVLFCRHLQSSRSHCWKVFHFLIFIYTELVVLCISYLLFIPSQFMYFYIICNQKRLCIFIISFILYSYICLFVFPKELKRTMILSSHGNEILHLESAKCRCVIPTYCTELRRCAWHQSTSLKTYNFLVGRWENVIVKDIKCQPGDKKIPPTLID